MTLTVKTLVKYCHLIGNRVDYVQGAGGNISLKDDSGIMAIKASGTQLDHVSHSNGIAYVSYENYAKQLLSCKKESDYNLLNQQQTRSDLAMERASMEVGFHAVLDIAVIHTHNVYANMLLCSHEGINVIKTEFPTATILDYVTPGLELSQQVFKLAAKNKNDIAVFFLKNHGVIVAANTLEKAYAEHEQITDRLSKLLNVTSYPSLNLSSESNHVIGTSSILTALIQKYGHAIIKSSVLFPDQAIYFLEHNIAFKENKRQYQSDKQAQACEALLLAYYMILDKINQHNWTACYLSDTQINSIMSLSSEKFRQGKIK